MIRRPPLKLRKYQKECFSTEWIATIGGGQYLIIRILDTGRAGHHDDYPWKAEVYTVLLPDDEPISDKGLIELFEIGGYGSGLYWSRSGDNYLELMFQAHGEAAWLADALVAA